VGDTRLSPSATLIDGLLAKGAACEVVDPLVDSFPEVDAPLHREVPPPAGYDAVVMAVAHRPFAEFDLAAWCGTARPLVVDANGVLGAAEIGRLRGLGLKVAAIGRGA
jgi:UDP-N-acetyl-D-mannosaminuronate dehydrogenase